MEEAGFVADDGAVQMDVEVFEGDGEEVGAMERLQSFWRGSGWARLLDAFEVCGDVHLLDGVALIEIVTSTKDLDVLSVS